MLLAITGNISLNGSLSGQLLLVALCHVLWDDCSSLRTQTRTNIAAYLDSALPFQDPGIQDQSS